MHAIDNLSLMTEYDTFTNWTRVEVEELKQTVLHNYHQFTTKFHESTDQFQDLLGAEVEDFKSNMKDTLRRNLALFERAKLEFERKIAPMLIEELGAKLNGSNWASELKEKLQHLKESIDSDDFQYV